MSVDRSHLINLFLAPKLTSFHERKDNNDAYITLLSENMKL